MPQSVLWLWQLPERFAERSPALNDFNFYWVYPARFNPGAMTLGAISASGHRVRATIEDHPRAGKRTLVKLALDPPLAPGARVTIDVDFETRIPERYGRFGCFRATCVLDGGFYPMVAALDGDLDAPPARASYRLTLRTPRVSDLVVNGNYRAIPKNGAQTFELDDAAEAAVIVGRPRLLARTIEHDGARVTLWSGAAKPVPSEPGQVLPYEPADRGARMLRTVENALDLLAGLGVDVSRERIVLVEGALRVELAESLPGFTLVSSDAFDIFPLARFLNFHEFEVARAIFAGLVDERVRARERHADLGFAPEVAAAWLVDAYTLRAFRHEEFAKDILKWVGFIPAIDRILYAPQVPYASAYFYTLEDPDPMRDSLEQFDNEKPRGKTIYAKLRDLLGDDGIAKVVRAQLDGAPLREAAERVYGAPLDWFFAEWLGPYPFVDYRFKSIATEFVDGKGPVHVIVVEKRGAHPPIEPVEVRARDRRGHVATERWDGRGREHTFTFFGLGEKLSSVEIDPRGRLVENLPGSNDDLRFDDRRPPRWKFVYNNFGGLVTVAPTFGLDLSLDFSLAPILDLKNSFRFVIAHTIASQIEVLFSYTRSFGRKVTAARLTQGLTTSFIAARLDPQFGLPIECTSRCSNPGTTLAARVGWGYDDRLYSWEPKRALSFGVGASYALTVLDRGLALSQVGVGASWESIVPLSDNHGLAMYTYIAANFGTLSTPGQMVSISGAGGLRGYALDELIGRAGGFARFEWRHNFIHSLDWNLLHALYVRGIGGGAFVEGGAISRCASYTFDASSPAADAGYSLRIFADWLGVSQTTFNLDLAVPLVHPTRDCLGNTFVAGERAPVGFFFYFGAPW